MGRVSTCQKNCKTIDLRGAQVNKDQIWWANSSCPHVRLTFGHAPLNFSHSLASDWSNNIHEFGNKTAVLIELKFGRFGHASLNSRRFPAFDIWYIWCPFFLFYSPCHCHWWKSPVRPAGKGGHYITLLDGPTPVWNCFSLSCLSYSLNRQRNDKYPNDIDSQKWELWRKPKANFVHTVMEHI